MRLFSTTRARRAGAAAGLALAAAACSNDSLVGLNDNQNSPVDAPAPPLFTNAVNNAVTRFRGATYDLTMTSLFAQHFAKVQYVDEDQYRLRTATTSALFLNPYSLELKDLDVAQQKGVTAKEPGTYVPAMVMKTWTFGVMTDTWGDIPYTQALQASETAGDLTPAYDPQQQIYQGFFATLDTAARAAAGAANTLGVADPVYGGDPAKWQRFANSLRARFALREIKADPADAARQLAAALAAPGGVMTSNADNAQLQWPGDGLNDNPYAANFKSRDDHRVSKVLVDTLNAYRDPRLPVYAQPTKADPAVYAGLQNGLSTANAGRFFNTTSRPGAIFYAGGTAYGTFGNPVNAKTPSYLMTYAELAFIKAEAAERGLAGLSPAQARGFYEDGIRASIEQWGVGGGGAAAAYIAQPGVAYAGGAEGLRQIALQKWIALYTQGSEAWSEYRRTGVPALVKGPAAVATVTNIPRRVLYATGEQSVNQEELQKAVGRQGADNFNTRVWWDKQ
jgi:hypothetical protein